ncbi:response regulator transcription factor [Paenibacillus andongensis]|uniref:response regulator transcription factor n=1 Tax=Paenibacillus andongensis TaxID=2975482 RepID=UPI0021BB9FF7|nr:response regulator [Paenibacillus andongensis]
MLKLLLVDDEQWVREHYSQWIDWASAGFTLIGPASSAKEAIRIMEQEIPHLLLTDIMMPDMDGLELAEYVRERYPQVHIMILTTYGEFDFAKRAISIGVSGYMIKQVQEADQLLTACRKVAEEIYRDMDVAHRLQLQGLQQRQSDWQERRQWLERMLSAPASLGAHPLPPGLDTIERQSGIVALLSIGWSGRELFGTASQQGEQAIRLQSEAGQVIERRYRDSVSVGKFVAVTVPWRNDKLFVFMRVPNIHSAAARLSFLRVEAGAVLDDVRTVTGVRGHAHAHLRQMGEVNWAELVRAGADALDAFFYHPTPMISDATPERFAVIPPSQYREWAAAVRKALQQRSTISFREAITPLLQEGVPPLRPAELIHVSHKLLDPALSEIPASVTERMTDLASVETWEEFGCWWDQTVNELDRAFGEHERLTYRKEVQSMCRFIHEKYAEDIQISDLAERVQLHPSYAGQLFKQETGEHFTDYLSRYRMKKAEELLTQTTMKIYEVAEAVGVDNYRYFCKLFKAYTGFTPTEYKKNQ